MSIQLNNPTALLDEELFRSAYSKKIQVPLTFAEDSEHTRQEFKDECDINTIMAQYLHTGEIVHMNEVAPQYLDCTGFDFQSQMDYVAGAFSLFEDLPSKIRLQFDNDPAAFLDFCSQEKNRPEMAQMGLLSDEAVARMQEVAPPSQPAPKAPPAAPEPAPEPSA